MEELPNKASPLQERAFRGEWDSPGLRMLCLFVNVATARVMSAVTLLLRSLPSAARCLGVTL